MIFYTKVFDDELKCITNSKNMKRKNKVENS